MADQPDNNPKRSAADKERSRQQSRPVSGRDPKGTSGSGKGGAKSGGGTRPSGSRPADKGRSGGGPTKGGPPGRTGAKGGTGGRGGQPPAKGRPAPRRSPAPFIWGAVAVVLVFVVVIVAITITSGSGSGGGNAVAPAPAALVSTVTSVPASAFDKVGITSTLSQAVPPTRASGLAPLTQDGKPSVFFFGAEFCPYCAAERWALITALSRFGTFHNLDVTKSSSTDVYPNTNTFSFRNATYSSPYITLQTVENENGNHQTLQVPNHQQQAILSHFKVTGYPFVDFGNKFTADSPAYDPGVLQGLSWDDIADGLSDPTNPVTQTILSASNYFSAAICENTKGQPASVCQSKGVKAAAKAMGVTY